MAKASRVSGKRAGSFFSAAAFFLLLTVFLPGAAQAAAPVVPPDPCIAKDANGNYQVNQNFQNAFAQVGYLKTNAAMQVLGMFGAIDVKAQYCWDNIKNLFETIGSLQGDSTNPFDSIVSAIISQISSQILNLINSACTAALTSITNFKSFLLSQLNNMCLPVPDLSLGLGKISALSFANAQPCGPPNNVPVFTFGYSATPVQTYNYRQW